MEKSPEQGFVFAELSTNPGAVAGLGVVFGLLRLAAAGGLLANRLWGWMLGVLVLLLVACYGSEKIAL